MILSIPLIFIPIIIGGFIVVRNEKLKQNLWKRLRFTKLKRKDWLWILLGLSGMAVGSAVTFQICKILGFDSNPPFARHVEAWTNGHYWMFSL